MGDLVSLGHAQAIDQIALRLAAPAAAVTTRGRGKLAELLEVTENPPARLLADNRVQAARQVPDLIGK